MVNLPRCFFSALLSLFLSPGASADFSLGRASGVVDLSLCPMASSVARSAAKKARTSKKVRMVLMMHGLDLKKILPSHGLPYHNLGQPPRGRIHHQWSERAV